MHRRLAARGERALAALTVLLALTAGSGGCSVNHGGLNTDPGADAATPGDGAGGPDLASDQPVSTDGGCGACGAAATFVTLPGGRFTGTTAGDSASEGSCGGADTPEAVFKLELFAASDLFVTTHGTDMDTVLYLRRGGCCGTEVACNDDADGRETSVLEQHGLPAGTYFIMVDGATSSDVGAFTIDIYATPTSPNPAEACGNPVRLPTDGLGGNTCGFRDDYSPLPGCSSGVSGTSGLDQVYYFVLDEPATVTFSTCNDTCIDTVLYVRDVCSDNISQRACDDDSCRASDSCLPDGNQVQSRLTATLAAGAHYLVLDTFSASQVACGAFTITANGL